MREDIINLPPAETEQPLYIPMVGTAYWDKNVVVTRKCFWSCCIEYIVQGRGKMEINGHTFYPSKGDICIFPLFSDYSCRADQNDPWVRMWIDVRGVLSNELLKLYGLSLIHISHGHRRRDAAPMSCRCHCHAGRGGGNGAERILPRLRAGAGLSFFKGSGTALLFQPEHQTG